MGLRPITCSLIYIAPQQYKCLFIRAMGPYKESTISYGPAAHNRVLYTIRGRTAPYLVAHIASQYALSYRPCGPITLLI